MLEKMRLESGLLVVALEGARSTRKILSGTSQIQVSQS